LPLRLLSGTVTTSGLPTAKAQIMLLSLRPQAIAGVAIVGAGLIAATPVTPPLPGVYVSAPAVQLTAAETFDLLDPLAALAATGDSAQSSIDSGIQTTLINAITAVETALSNGSVALGTALSTPLDNIGTALSNLATTISDMGGASVFIGGIVDNFASPFSELGVLTDLLLADIVPSAIIAPLFDIPTQLVLFGSNVFDVLTGMPVGSDLAAGVSGVSAQAVGAQSIESMIQTLLIDFGGPNGTLDTIGSAFFESFFQTVVPAPFDLVQTSLNAIGSFIGDISPVFGPIDTIFGDLGTLTANSGELLSLLPAIPYATLVEPLVFGNFQQLVDLGSFLIDGGSSSAADAAGLPDLGAGLVADLSAVDPGLAADLGGLLGAVPADLASLPTDLLTIF
jgi:hypothetical protein